MKQIILLLVGNLENNFMRGLFYYSGFYCYVNYCDTSKCKTIIHSNLSVLIGIVHVLITLTLTCNVRSTVSDNMVLQTSCSCLYLQNLLQNVLYCEYHAEFLHCAASMERACCSWDVLGTYGQSQDNDLFSCQKGVSIHTFLGLQNIQDTFLPR